jgi:hypothetical protein
MMIISYVSAAIAYLSRLMGKLSGASRPPRHSRLNLHHSTAQHSTACPPLNVSTPSSQAARCAAELVGMVPPPVWAHVRECGLNKTKRRTRHCSCNQSFTTLDTSDIDRPLHTSSNARWRTCWASATRCPPPVCAFVGQCLQTIRR